MSHACNVCNFEPVPDGDGVECPHCHRLQYGRKCPRCGQNAPTIIRGMSVYCSACNAERGPLAGVPLNLVGRPTRIGGTVTRVVGFGALVATVVTATVLGLLVALVGTATGGLITAAVVMVLGLTIGALMLRGGRKLEQRGDTKQKHAREQAIYALANNRRGVVTAADVARALNVQIAEADALLTEMARDGSRVGVEIDGQGTVNYTIRDAIAPMGSSAPVDTSPPLRVDVGGVRVEPASGDPAERERDRIRAEVDREYEQMKARK